MDLAEALLEVKQLSMRNEVLEQKYLSVLKENAFVQRENERLSRVNEKYKSITENLGNKIIQLKEELSLALYRRFGKAAEQFKGQQELPFDNEAEEALQELEEGEAETQSITYKRRKPGRKKLDASLPRKQIFHTLSEEEKLCGCGQQMHKIGEDVTERLNVIPAQVWVEEHYHEKYACRHCQGVNDSEEAGVRTAKGDEPLLKGSITTAGLVSFIWTQKFCDHLPFYRQQQAFSRIGAYISRQDMSNWTTRLSGELEPLVKLIEEDIKSGPVMHMDETPVKVLKLDRSGKDGLGYMWLSVGGGCGKRSAVYRFASGRAAIHAEEFLSCYSGFLQTDGYKGYDSLNAGSAWTHVGCWAHARRKFFEADKASSSAITKDALGRIKKLYEIEEKARSSGLQGEEFLIYRKKLFKPFFESFKALMLSLKGQVLPESLIGKAISYTLSQWEKLMRFLDHPDLTPDNNRAENAIRPFVVGRKNWLFSGNDESAKSSCHVYSLVETLKLNGIEPYQGLKRILERLPEVRKTGDWESLLPWNLFDDSGQN